MKNKGFVHDGEKIKDFSAKCEKCGSDNVEVKYEFNYYGGATGYDHNLDIKCLDCNNYAYLYI